jgi:hypothetical protein
MNITARVMCTLKWNQKKTIAEVEVTRSMAIQSRLLQVTSLSS